VQINVIFLIGWLYHANCNNIPTPLLLVIFQHQQTSLIMESLIKWVMKYFLTEIVEDAHLLNENMKLGFLLGEFTFENIRIRRNFFEQILGNMEIVCVGIRKVHLTVPWTNLGKEKMRLNIEDVTCLAKSSFQYDYWTHRRRTQESKLSLAKSIARTTILKQTSQDWNLFRQISALASSYINDVFQSSFISLLNTVEIHVNGVHFRYEDFLSSSDSSGFCFGVMISNLSFECLSEKVFPQKSNADRPQNASVINKLVEIKNIRGYFLDLSPHFASSTSSSTFQIPYSLSNRSQIPDLMCLHRFSVNEFQEHVILSKLDTFVQINATLDLGRKSVEVRSRIILLISIFYSLPG
jgi:hypothetical protein